MFSDQVFVTEDRMLGDPATGSRSHAPAWTPTDSASPPSFDPEASVATMVATDKALQVTTDAVQVFGGFGYTRDLLVERYLRGATVTQCSRAPTRSNGG